MTIRESVTITIPAPCSLMWSNDRGHWAVRHRQTRMWRRQAADFARAHRPRIAFDGPVWIVATVHRNHNRGRWDVANTMPTIKAIVDGLVDAEVIADDSNAHVIGPDLRPGEPRKRIEVELHITPVDP